MVIYLVYFCSQAIVYKHIPDTVHLLCHWIFILRRLIFSVFAMRRMKYAIGISVPSHALMSPRLAS